MYVSMRYMHVCAKMFATTTRARGCSATQQTQVNKSAGTADQRGGRLLQEAIIYWLRVADNSHVASSVQRPQAVGNIEWR